MGFFTLLLAVSRIRWRHRHQEVVEMLSACFTGLLGTDRATSYEAGALDTVEQQKCLQPPLQNVEEARTGRAKAFTRELKAHPARSHPTVAGSPGRGMRSGAMPGAGTADPAKA